MIKAALLVVVKAKPGKENDVASFLESARSIVEQEQGTRAWFAIQMDASTFGIFDVFPDDAARQTHLAGGVGQALAARGRRCSAKLRAPRTSMFSRSSWGSGSNGREIVVFPGQSTLVSGSADEVQDDPELHIRLFFGEYYGDPL